jgi:hypothetical protein
MSLALIIELQRLASQRTVFSQIDSPQDALGVTWRYHGEEPNFWPFFPWFCPHFEASI